MTRRLAIPARLASECRNDARLMPTWTSAKPPSAEDAEFMLFDEGWIKIDEWTSAEEI